MYADIPVSVLQVPAGSYGEPGGLPNFLKEKKRRSLMRKRRRMMRKKEEDEEEKKENYDKEKELEGKRRDEEG